MTYSKQLLAHFNEPKNVGCFPAEEQAIGRAQIGNYENGVIIHFEIKIDTQNKIQAAKFKAYGNCAVIAACSFMTEWLCGKALQDVNNFTSQLIIEKLIIPDLKAHCALLVEDVVKAAIKNYTLKGISV